MPRFRVRKTPVRDLSASANRRGVFVCVPSHDDKSGLKRWWALDRSNAHRLKTAPFIGENTPVRLILQFRRGVIDIQSFPPCLAF